MPSFLLQIQAVPSYPGIHEASHSCNADEFSENELRHMGIRALIIRAIRAGNEDETNHILYQAIFIYGSFSTLIASIGIFLVEPISVMKGLDYG
ncbi:hypothetical protein ACFLWR_03450 [Chloroflexota bacterium]